MGSNEYDKGIRNYTINYDICASTDAHDCPSKKKLTQSLSSMWAMLYLLLLPLIVLASHPTTAFNIDAFEIY